MKYLCILAAFTAVGCSSPKISTTVPDLPVDTTVTSMEFLATMQHPLPKGKNVAYTPSFLHAWVRLTEELGGAIAATNHNDDALLLNNSATWQNALLANEYVTEAEREGDIIKVRASFVKRLPFELPMDTAMDGMLFMGHRVKGFGMHYYKDDVAGQMQIVYYENDDRFIVKLQPKDRAQEILYAKGFDTGSTFEHVWSAMQNAIICGKAEKKNDTLYSKYYFLEDDKFLAPAVRFDHTLSVTKLTGDGIIADGNPYVIQKATLRIGFLINEIGAEVISVAELEAAAAAYPDPPKPKLMLLDKPFFMAIKRASAQYPYLMMRVENTDIMERR